MKLLRVGEVYVGLAVSEDMLMMMMMMAPVWVWVALGCIATTMAATSAPNIVFILADDLGWSDVSWHDPRVVSPNLHKLIDEGVTLDQNYVQPSCTPTRSALLSGYYPFHLGRQGFPLAEMTPAGLTVNVTLLPEDLAALGYSTHLVGKWHLGFCNEAYLPTRRGFQSFYGQYVGRHHHYNHSYDGGYDFRDGDRVALEANGTYNPVLLTERAVRIIQQQEGKQSPFFLYLAYQHVHTPLEVPDEYLALYPSESDPDRRKMLAMVTAMDDAVGRVVAAIKASTFANNTIIVFSSDNGGEYPVGLNLPLRGAKLSQWEGGTRVAGLVHGAMFENTPRRHGGLLHVTDWRSTLLAAAGAAVLPSTDGFNQWEALRTGRGRSPRKSLVYDIEQAGDDISGAIRVGRYKLLVGPQNFTEEEGPWLFDLKKDPYETTNLAAARPGLRKRLERVLRKKAKEMVPQDRPVDDPAGDAENFGGIWSPGWCEAR